MAGYKRLSFTRDHRSLFALYQTVPDAVLLWTARPGVSRMLGNVQRLGQGNLCQVQSYNLSCGT